MKHKNKYYIIILITALVLSVATPFLSQRLIQASDFVITVTSSNNSGAGSLRQAISNANVSDSDVLINFDSLVSQVDITSPLPTLTSVDFTITIDGGPTGVIINNDGGFSDAPLQIGIGSPVATNSTNNIIRNLTFDGFENGIVVYGENNRIENVTINGITDEDGTCHGQIGIAVLPRVALIAEPDGSLLTPASGNTIINNNISCFRKGIMAQKMDDVIISRNTIWANNANTVIDLDDDLYACHMAGIDIQGTRVLGAGEVGHNFISDNRIYNNGIEFTAGPTSCDESTFEAGGIILSQFDDSTPADNIYISHNSIFGNTYNGIKLINASNNVINANDIYSNGMAASLAPDEAVADLGYGVFLTCDDSTTGSRRNVILGNDIYQNADDGILVNASCVDGDDEVYPENNDQNPILANSIYENGRIRTGTGAGLVEDDGIGINLLENGVSSESYNLGHAVSLSISANDSGDEDFGGNDVQNKPTIASATYDADSLTWTVSGQTGTGSGAIIELFQVGCSSGATFTVQSCDADDFTSTGTGYGEGRYFLARTAVSESGSGTGWTITVPASAGFNGGLLTATATTYTDFEDSSCPILDGISEASTFDELDIGFARFCNTSEFGKNYFAQQNAGTVVLNKYASSANVAQGGTERFLISVTNNRNHALTSVLLTDELNPILDYTTDSCIWEIGTIPTLPDRTCSFSNNEILLDGFTSLAAHNTLYVVFDTVVAPSAEPLSYTNTVTATVVPTVEVGPAIANFTVTEATSGGGGGGACSTPDINPSATFTINGSAHSDTYATTADTRTFANPTVGGNGPGISYRWLLDGVIVEEGTAEANNTTDINLTVGSHIVTHIVSDCDGDIVLDSVAITVTGNASTTLTLAKTISPNNNLRNSDLVTVDIQVTNPPTSNTLTALALDDDLTGLSTSVPSCFFALDVLPTSSSSACTVGANGGISLTLPTGGLQPGHTLHIRYLTTAAGVAGSYTNVVAYTSSTPTLATVPGNAQATHTIIGTSEACPSTSNVDAEFTVNTQPTPESSISGTAGSYTFANTSTSGDGVINYRWFINGVFQTENASSITRTLSETSIITLLKQDCDGTVANGGIDTDILTINFSSTPPATTTGPFIVTKTTSDGLSMYALSSRTIAYQVQITNTDTETHTYNLVDTIPSAFQGSVTITDSAGGTNVSSARQIVINGITLAAQQTKTVRYTLTLVDKSDFPLEDFDLDNSARKTDSDFYAEAVEDATISRTNNRHAREDDILDKPDNKFVSLNKNGEIIVDVGESKAIVNGSGDDFALFLRNSSSDDTDNTDEQYQVSVSQDGDTFKKVNGEGSFDISRTRLGWVRFIKIEDESVNALASAPGVDIDAVCLLNIGVPVTNNVAVTGGTVTNRTQRTVYIDVTKAFSHPLKKSDCEEEVIEKAARTLELPLPPPLPTPAPAQILPQPILPKTGSEALVLGSFIFVLNFLRSLRKK